MPLPPRTAIRPEYHPPVAGTSLEKTFTGYIAACESCGQDCWWVAKDPHGTCPCTDEVAA